MVVRFQRGEKEAWQEGGKEVEATECAKWLSAERRRKRMGKRSKRPSIASRILVFSLRPAIKKPDDHTHTNSTNSTTTQDVKN